MVEKVAEEWMTGVYSMSSLSKRIPFPFEIMVCILNCACCIYVWGVGVGLGVGERVAWRIPIFTLPLSVQNCDVYQILVLAGLEKDLVTRLTHWMINHKLIGCITCSYTRDMYNPLVT